MNRKDLPFRKELTSQFLQNARDKTSRELLRNMLQVAEIVRSDILFPAAKNLNAIVIEQKELDTMRSAPAKTFTIKTDQDCDIAAEKALLKLYPDAFVLGEEKFGKADEPQKIAYLQEALTTDKLVFITDSLDGTSNFRTGFDGYAVMFTAMRNNEVIATLAYRCTDHADPFGYGHTLTYAADDCVRIDGRSVSSLDKRIFPELVGKLRGYAGLEYIKATKEDNGFPNLSGQFDSLSDHWTCSKLYTDLLKGDHHFMLVPPPLDIFDYPAGVAMIQKAGGVARYLDGTDASFAEIIRRQPFGKEDPAASKSIENTLVFAVSESVFATVQKTVLAKAQLLKLKR